MEITTGIIMTGIGLCGIVVGIILQIVLIGVFKKQRKKLLENLGKI